jgi:hypothetical protein
MSTSFYGTLPEATSVIKTTTTTIVSSSSSSDNAKSVPIPITSTVTREEFVEFPDVDFQTKKFTKYLDEADLDFEKTFQQQSAVHTSTTSSSSETKESSSSAASSITTVTTTSSTIVQSSSATEKEEKDEKLWEKPLGEWKSCERVIEVS